MEYRVIDEHNQVQTFEGFRRYVSDRPVDTTERLAVVWQGGEPDFWVVDDAIGMDELDRYYRMMCDGREAVTVQTCECVIKRLNY